MIVIKKAGLKDKKIIKAMWDEAFYFDDNGYTDYFFSNVYQRDNCYILKENNEIKTSLSIIPHKLMLNGQVIDTSIIVGVVTNKKDQNKGYMKRLFSYVLKIKQEQEMITLIQAYEPKLYQRYGFDISYYKNYYQVKLQKNNDKVRPLRKKEYKYCLDVYQKMMENFNGYILRDKNYYQLLAQELKYTKGVLYGIIENKKCLGYYIFDKNQNMVTEIIYQDENIFNLMLDHISNLSQDIKIMLATDEIKNNDKLIFIEKRQFMLVRINDEDQIKAHFNFKAKKYEDLLILGQKVPYINEYA